MIVIADSGSSKTDWVLIQKDHSIKTIETCGINPFFQQAEQIVTSLNNYFIKENGSEVNQVFFYGAGCIKDVTDSTVQTALRQIFPLASVEVHDDMLGAARALLGNEKGIACILGTGSNSCLYDGLGITDKIPALGYVLGDEGGGAYLGKMFLNSYFKRILPKNLSDLADAQLKLELPEVLSSVYKQEYPNRYLAGISRFVIENQTHPFMKKMIKQGLEAFMTKNVELYHDYKNLPVCFTGSVAFHCAELLKEVAEQRKIKVGKILHKPIEGLLKYHLGQ